MTREHRGLLYVLLATVGFGMIPIMAKIAYSNGANAVTVLALRFMVAGAFFLAHTTTRRISLRVSKNTFLALLSLGMLGYGTMCLLFFSCFKYISPSIGELLHYTYPAIVAIGAHLFLGEKLTPRKSVSLFLSFAGLALVLWAPWTVFQVQGISMVLATAAINALYVIGSKRILCDVDPVIAATYTSCGCAVYFLIYGLITGTLDFHLTLGAIGATAILAFWSTIIGLFAFLAGLSMLGAIKASIVSTFEPVVTVILAYIVLHDVISLRQLIGGLLTVGSVLLLETEGKSKESGAHAGGR